MTRNNTSYSYDYLTQITFGHVSRIQKQPPKVFYKKGVLRNFAKLAGRHLCQGLFFNKFAGRRPETLFKKRLQHKCFPVNFVKLLRIPFLQNTFGRLLL